MRSQEINKQTIYYSLYGSKSPVLDDNGDETGEYAISYSNPLKFKIRVSPCKGEATDQVFGKSLDYDRAMNTTDKAFLIDEYSCLWIDSIPQLNTDGTLKLGTDDKPLTPHNYKVVGVSKDLNEWMFAVKKVF
jgi:hypothetical protein